MPGRKPKPDEPIAWHLKRIGFEGTLALARKIDSNEIRSGDPFRVDLAEISLFLMDREGLEERGWLVRVKGPDWTIRVETQSRIPVLEPTISDMEDGLAEILPKVDEDTWEIEGDEESAFRWMERNFVSLRRVLLQQAERSRMKRIFKFIGAAAAALLAVVYLLSCTTELVVSL